MALSECPLPQRLPVGLALQGAEERSRYASEASFDRAMRALLRVPAQRPAPRQRELYRAFSTSMVLSGLRCLLSYIVLPVLTPALGLAAGVAPTIGIPVALVALVFDVIGLRRFWLADHRSRRPMTAVYAGVMAMVASLLGLDLAHLFS